MSGAVETGVSEGPAKRILVTGGGTGLGAAIVRGLVTAGYAVDFTYRASGEAATALAAELNEAHPGLGIRGIPLTSPTGRRWTRSAIRLRRSAITASSTMPASRATGSPPSSTRTRPRRRCR